MNEYINFLKEQRDYLVKRYSNEDNIIEPVVTVAYDCGERYIVFCHPEDTTCSNLDEFKHIYGVI